MDRIRGKNTEEYDPHLHRNLPNPTSNMDTLIHLLKGSLGSGILAMPQAFSRVGLIMGCIATAVVGILITHCLHVLIRSEYEACKRRHIPNITYPMTMITLIKDGPKPFRPFANCLAILVDVFLIVYGLGTCCVYILFIADNLKKLVDPHYQMPIEYYMLIILIPLILLNLITNLKALAPISALSNVITIISLIIIVYITLSTKKSTEPMSNWGTLPGYPLFFGTVMFALTSVGVVVSAEGNMKTPKAFGQPFGVLNIAMGFVVLLYMLVGAIGYAYCSTECSDIITLDLPSGALGTTVMVLYIIAILTSYALHCYVPIEILWRDYLEPRLERKQATPERKRAYLYGLRIGLCIMTFLVTMAVPRLGLFISLFGALCLSALAISFPVLMEICTYYPDRYGPCHFRLLKDILLFLFGLVGLHNGHSMVYWQSLRIIIEVPPVPQIVD
ncbi:unnamed protein product [Arctia plantaginis]|uniref:Amino acid transporter transmembrane domain-containing protein n=1 Tax=Arctia plantaginis TaxID=874455 RepID=A0A8S1BP51_ARCPL|nr:unnamed protein product [Arctia plantaginis]